MVNEGNTNMVKLMIENGIDDVNSKTVGGCTSLLQASRYGHNEVVTLLINAGADVNAKTVGGWTPLQYASSNGHLETVKLLIEAKADHTIKTINGETAYDIAVQYKTEEVAKYLKSLEVPSLTMVIGDQRIPLTPGMVIKIE